MKFHPKSAILASLWRNDDRPDLIGEESPDSRKPGVKRKLKRVSASKSHRDYVGLTTLKVVRNE